MNDFDLKCNTLAKKVSYGVLGLTLVLLLPILFGIAAAALGTVVAAWAAVVGGLALVNSIPVLSMKFANWKLSALKNEAATNPIETLQNQAQVMAEQIDAYATALTNRKAEGKLFIQEIDEFRKEDPEGAAAYDEELRAYEVEIKQMELNLSTAVKDLEQFRELIKKADRRWKMAQASESFRKGAPSERELILQNILKDAALDSVSKKAHTAASRLQVDSIMTMARQEHKESKKKSLPVLDNNPSPTLQVLDMSAVEDAKVKV